LLAEDDGQRADLHTQTGQNQSDWYILPKRRLRLSSALTSTFACSCTQRATSFAFFVKGILLMYIRVSPTFSINGTGGMSRSHFDSSAAFSAGTGCGGGEESSVARCSEAIGAGGIRATQGGCAEIWRYCCEAKSTSGERAENTSCESFSSLHDPITGEEMI
jgi:hypothetical protein